jgi:hypothetical protein
MFIKFRGEKMSSKDVSERSKELVPFGLRFRDPALRKEIKKEAISLDVEMSEYIVAILRERKKVLPLIKKY